MRFIPRVLGPVCLLIGAALLGDALVTGGARLYLLLIFPVFSGTSPAFFLSVLLLVVGFLLFPFVFLGDTPAEPGGAAPGPYPPAPSSAETTSGGLILVGPIPIFFGAWRRNPPISYRWAILLGAILAVVAVLLLWGVSVL
jgi:uncharacterized membrane protein